MTDEQPERNGSDNNLYHCDYCDTDYHPLADMKSIKVNGKDFFVCSICYITLSFKMTKTPPLQTDESVDNGK